MNNFKFAKISKVESWSTENKEVSLYKNVSKFHDYIFECIKNPKHMTWISENDNKNIMNGVLQTQEMSNLTLGLMTDILSPRRNFEKEFNYETLGYSGPKFLKISGNLESFFYQEKMNSAQASLLIVYFFNEDFKGGQIILKDYNDLISPKSNEMIILPVKEVDYEVSPIISGEQYVFVIVLEKKE